MKLYDQCFSVGKSIFLFHFSQDGGDLVRKIGGVFAFKVKDGPGGKEALWVVDVKNGNGSVTNDAGVRTFILYLYPHV